MPIIHRQDNLEFFIEPSFSPPPHVRITSGNGVIVIRIGVPETELPYIEKYEQVSREDVDLAFDIVSDYQEKFLNAWNKIHGVPSS